MTSARESEWLSSCVQNMKDSNLKVGSKRADLLRIFIPSGGLSSRSSGTFVYRENPHVKVEVRFKPAQGDENAKLSEFLPDDIIVQISEPHLGPTVID